MTTIYIVCDHNFVLSVYRKYEDAEAYASERANRRNYKRDDELELKEVILWSHVEWGREYRYISIEKWEMVD